MANGGARVGAGRKKKVDELKVQQLAIKSITEKYGGEEEGFKALLESREASLIKFVFEHAYGKPKEKVELSSDKDSPVLFRLDGRFKDSNS